MNRLTRVLLAVVAGLVVGGGISYATSTSSKNSQPSKAQIRSAKLWPVASGLRHRFAAFAQPKHHRHHHAATASSATASPTELPASVAASFEEPNQAAGNYYPNAAEAVYVQPNKSVSGFWIVPGKTGACIVWKTTTEWPEPQANCSPLAQVEEHGMIAMSTSNGPAELLFGFVPNGTESVKVTNADGTTVSAPVVNNAYMLVDATNNAESLQAHLTSASGTEIHVWKLPKP